MLGLATWFSSLLLKLVRYDKLQLKNVWETEEELPAASKTFLYGKGFSLFAYLIWLMAGEWGWRWRFFTAADFRAARFLPRHGVVASLQK